MSIDWKKKKNKYIAAAVGICMLGVGIAACSPATQGTTNETGTTQAVAGETSTQTATGQATQPPAEGDQAATTAAPAQDQAATTAAPATEQAVATNQAPTPATTDQTAATNQAPTPTTTEQAAATTQAPGQVTATADQEAATTQAPGQVTATADQEAATTQAPGQVTATADQEAATTQAPAPATEQAAATTQAPAPATTEQAAATTQAPAQDQPAPASTQAQADQTNDQAAQDQAAAGNDQAAADENQAQEMTEQDYTYYIVLDPGHGGNDSGADGWNSSEKRLNLIIAKYLKKELEQYEHVKVGFTRKKDVYVGLHDRVKIAQKKNADLLISLHNDSWDAGLPYDNGSSVLVAKKGSYRPELAMQEARLARNILAELEELGLVKRGLLRKKSDRVPTYEDGSLGDYHAIIRDGMRAGLPSILIEHAFCDNEHDYNNFLKTNEQLQALAAADARGVARFLHLKRKGTGEVIPPLVVEGKKQECTPKKDAYYSLARKRYNNIEFDKEQVRKKVEAENAANAPAQDQTGSETASQEQANDQAALEARIRAVSIARKNISAEKKVPQVLLISLAIPFCLILIKEFDFGFRIEFRVKKRNDKYKPWNYHELKYHM